MEAALNPSDPHLPDLLPAEPFGLFVEWFEEAHRLRVQPNPNAMTLATVDGRGRPSARVVLCKKMDPVAGFVVFHTNYRGRKGRELSANPYAAVVMHWDALDRQVRIEGPVTRSPEAESDAYFRSRSWLRRVGAWASEQSEPVGGAGGRDELQARVEAAFRRFGLDPANPPARDAEIDIPRPPHWGGFRVWAERVELWVGGTGRLHDRAVWQRGLSPITGVEGDGFEESRPWVATRLQP